MLEGSSRGDVTKSIGSDVQEEYGCVAGGGGGGGLEAESVGLGLPNIADKMEYSRLAASEVKEKL